jgi:hypothetical protein
MGKHFSGEITGAEPKVFTPGEDMEFHVSWSADLLSGGSGWHSWVEAKYGTRKDVTATISHWGSNATIPIVISHLGGYGSQDNVINLSTMPDEVVHGELKLYGSAAFGAGTELIDTKDITIYPHDYIGESEDSANEVQTATAPLITPSALPDTLKYVLWILLAVIALIVIYQIIKVVK